MYVAKESRKWRVALVIHPYQNLDSRLLAKEVTEECLKETDPAFILLCFKYCIIFQIVNLTFTG